LSLLKPRADKAMAPQTDLVKRIGTTPSRQWIITTPSGFETFFSRCADEFAQPGGPDMGRIVAISGEHGIEYVTPTQA
jgi:hypothetical protein